MPYTTNENLQDTIKNSLPESAQSIYRNAFNLAYKKTPNDETAAKTGWSAVKSAGWVKTSGGNWMKNNSELKDIEIFSTGTYHGEKFNKSDLDGIANNFQVLKDKVKPVFKMAHGNEIHKVNGQPAMGWASEIKRVGNKLLASFKDVPEVVKKAIDKKLYKRVSAEIYSGLNIGGKKYKRVLSGVGLLGADVPEVKDLKDIEAFFADDNQAVSTYSMDVSNGVIMKTEEFDMSDELKKTFDERLKLLEDTHALDIKRFSEQRDADLAVKDAELKKFAEDQKTALAVKDAVISEMKDAGAKKEGEGKITEFKSFCEAQVTAGKMVPAARDILVKDIEKMEFSEGQEFSISFDKFKEFSEKTVEILDKAEHGIYTPPGNRGPESKTFTEKPGAKLEGIDVDAKATKIMVDRKCTYTEAVAFALESDPKMFHRFAEAGFKEEGA